MSGSVWDKYKIPQDPSGNIPEADAVLPQRKPDDLPPAAQEKAEAEGRQETADKGLPKPAEVKPSGTPKYEKKVYTGGTDFKLERPDGTPIDVDLPKSPALIEDPDRPVKPADVPKAVYGSPAMAERLSPAQRDIRDTAVPTPGVYGSPAIAEREARLADEKAAKAAEAERKAQTEKPKAAKPASAAASPALADKASEPSTGWRESPASLRMKEEKYYLSPAQLTGFAVREAREKLTGKPLDVDGLMKRLEDAHRSFDNQLTYASPTTAQDIYARRKKAVEDAVAAHATAVGSTNRRALEMEAASRGIPLASMIEQYETDDKSTPRATDLLEATKKRGVDLERLNRLDDIDINWASFSPQIFQSETTTGVLGNDETDKDVEIVKPGELGYEAALMMLNAVEVDGYNVGYIIKLSNERGGAQRWVEQRTADLAAGLTSADPQYDEKMGRAYQRAIAEIFAFKTVGLWASPIFMNDLIAPDYSKGLGERLWDAVKNQQEVIGYGPTSDPNKPRLITRARSAPATFMDAIDIPQQATVGFVEEIANKGWDQADFAEGAVKGIEDKRDFMQAALQSDWAKPTQVYDAFGQLKLDADGNPIMEGEWKPLVAGGLGFTASVLFPDLTLYAGKAVGVGTDAYKGLRDGRRLAEATNLVDSVIALRSEGAATLRHAEEMNKKFRDAIASGASAAEVDKWRLAASDSRQLARAAFDEAAVQEAKLRSKYKMVAEDVDRMDAGVAADLAKDNPDIFNTRLAQAASQSDELLTLHPSMRRMKTKAPVVSDMRAKQPTELSTVDYEDLFNTSRIIGSIDQTLGETPSAEAVARVLRTTASNDVADIRRVIGDDDVAVQLLNDIEDTLPQAVADPKAWSRAILDRRNDLPSINPPDDAADAVKEVAKEKRKKLVRAVVNIYSKAKVAAKDASTDIRGRAIDAALTNNESRIAAASIMAERLRAMKGSKKSQLKNVQPDPTIDMALEKADYDAALTDGGLAFKKMLIEAGLPEKEAQVAAVITDARARVASWKRGISTDEWYATRIEGVVKGDASKFTADTLYQESLAKNTDVSRLAVPEGFFSPLQRAIAKVIGDNNGRPVKSGYLLQQVKKQSGVKADELQWSGLEEFLAGKEKVSLEEVTEWLTTREPVVEVRGVTVDPEFDKRVTEAADAAAAAHAKLSSLRSDAKQLKRELLSSHRHAVDARLKEIDREKLSVVDSDVERWRVLDKEEEITRKLQNRFDDNAAEYGMFDLAKYARKRVEGSAATNTHLESMLNSVKAHPDGEEILLYWYDSYNDAVSVNSAAQTALMEARKSRGAPEYGRWVAPGPSENYREIRFIQPSIPHSGGTHHINLEPNAIAHLRTTDRVTEDGKKVLFVEEVQSDWHQAGAKEGYLPVNHVTETARKLQDAEAERDAAWQRVREFKSKPYAAAHPDYLRAQQERSQVLQAIDRTYGPGTKDERVALERRAAELQKEMQRVYEAGRDEAHRLEGAAVDADRKVALLKETPSQPLPGAHAETWRELALKQALIIAAREGYDGVAMTRGPIIARVAGGSGVGGELPGQLAFYEEILPNTAASLAKKNGSRLETTRLNVGAVVDDEKVKELRAAYKEKDKQEELFHKAVADFDAARKQRPDIIDFPAIAAEFDTTRPRLALEAAKDTIYRLEGRRAYDAEDMADALAADDITKNDVMPGAWKKVDGGVSNVPYIPVTDAMKAKVESEGLPLFSRDTVNTPAFKKWFGDSKVVAEDPIRAERARLREKKLLDGANQLSLRRVSDTIADLESLNVHVPDDAKTADGFIRWAENAKLPDTDERLMRAKRSYYENYDDDSAAEEALAEMERLEASGVVDYDRAEGLIEVTLKGIAGDRKAVESLAEPPGPLVLYHGTASDFDAFTPSAFGKYGPGVYLSDKPETAGSYANQAATTRNGGVGQRTLPVYARIERPLDSHVMPDDEYLSRVVSRLKSGVDGPVDGSVEDAIKFLSSKEEIENEILRNPQGWLYRAGHPKYGYSNETAKAALFDEARKAGYDGIIGRDFNNDTEYVVFSPEQVKSVHNSGAFNPQDPRLLYSKDASTAARLVETHSGVVTGHGSEFINRELLRGVTTAKEAAAMVYRATRNPAYVHLSSGLMQLLDSDATFAVVNRAGKRSTAGNWRVARAENKRYYPDVVTVASSAGYVSTQTILHELVHSATSQLLHRAFPEPGFAERAVPLTKKQREAADGVKRCYDILQEELRKPGAAETLGLYADEATGIVSADQSYGFTDVHEFVAEAFTNPEFQSILARIPSREPKKSMWQELLSEIAKMLGQDTSEVSETLLNDVINYGSALMLNDIKGKNALRAKAPEATKGNFFFSEDSSTAARLLEANQRAADAKAEVDRLTDALDKTKKRADTVRKAIDATKKSKISPDRLRDSVVKLRAEAVALKSDIETISEQLKAAKATHAEASKAATLAKKADEAADKVVVKADKKGESVPVTQARARLTAAKKEYNAAARQLAEAKIALADAVSSKAKPGDIKTLKLRVEAAAALEKAKGTVVESANNLLSKTLVGDAKAAPVTPTVQTASPAAAKVAPGKPVTPTDATSAPLPAAHGTPMGGVAPAVKASPDAASAVSEEELYQDAVDFVSNEGKASPSMIQRQFKIGYNRAGAMLDRMEKEGIVGPFDAAKPREVFGRKTPRPTAKTTPDIVDDAVGAPPKTLDASTPSAEATVKMPVEVEEVDDAVDASRVAGAEAAQDAEVTAREVTHKPSGRFGLNDDEATVDAALSVSDEAKHTGAQKLPRGAVTFAEDGRAIIHAFEGANVETIMHEVGHIMRRDLDADEVDDVVTWMRAQTGDNSLDIVDGRMVSDSGADAIVTAEEVFAEGFVAYLRTGIAPTNNLQRAFDYMKTWLREIYKAVRGFFPTSVSKETGAMFEKLLSVEKSEEAMRKAMASGIDPKATPNIIKRVYKELIGPTLPQAPKTMDELAKAARASGLDVDAATLDDMMKRHGKIDFPHPVAGKATYTDEDLRRFQATVERARGAAREEARLKQALSGAHEAIVEETPTEALRNRVAGDRMGSALARAATATFIGLDADFDLRALPTNIRAYIKVGARIVEAAYADGVKLLQERSPEKFRAWLTGRPTKFHNGRNAISSGYDYAGAVRSNLQLAFSTLTDEARAGAKVAMASAENGAPAFIPERLRKANALAVNQTLYASNSDFIKQLGEVLGIPSDGARNDPRPMETVLTGALHRYAHPSPDIDSYAAVDDFLDIIEDTYGPDKAARVGLLIAGHGAGHKAIQKYYNLGVTVNPEEAQVFQSWLHAEKMSDADRAKALRTAEKFGLDPRFVPVSGQFGTIHVPEAARKRLAAAMAKPSQKSLHWLSSPNDIGRGIYKDDVKPGQLAYDGIGFFVRGLKAGMTRGNLLVSSWFNFANTIDRMNQVATKAGFGAAMATMTRVLAQDMLIFTPLVSRAADVGRRFGVFGPDAIEAMRRVLSEGGDRMAVAVQKMALANSCSISTNKVLDGVDETANLGGRWYNYKDLRQVYIDQGVASSYAGELENSIRKSIRPPEGLVEKLGDRLASYMEYVEEMHEGLAERERVGAMLTFIEMGASPEDAAKLAVAALFDYGSSIAPAERSAFLALFFPFWAFQKNANMFTINSLLTPWGAYRVGVIRRTWEGSTEALSELIYGSVADPYGVDTEALGDVGRANYYALRAEIEAFYGGSERVPDDVVLALRHLFGQLPAYMLKDGKIQQLSEKLQNVVTLISGSDRRTDPLTAHNAMLEIGEAYVPKPDPSKRAGYNRDRPTIAVTFPKTENMKRYLSLAGDDHPYVELMLPEQTIVAGLRHTLNLLAATVLLPQKLIAWADGAYTDDGVEKMWHGMDETYIAGPLTQVMDPDRSILLPEIAADFFGGEDPPPYRIAPVIGELMADLGLPLVKTDAVTDPFALGTDASPEAVAENARLMGNPAWTGRPSSDKNVGIVSAPRYYVPGGVWATLCRRLSGFHDINRLLMSADESTLEGAAGLRGDLIVAASIALGIQEAESTGVKTAAREEPRKPDDALNPNK